MGREPQSATFEPVRLGRGARRTHWLGLAWLAALLAVAGIAAVNVRPADHAEADVDARASEARSLSQATAPAPIETSQPIAILDVIEARSIDATSGGMSRRLEITAHVLVAAARVRVTLEGREDRILATVVGELVRQAPFAGPITRSTYLAAFELPRSRSGGVWITLTAFDSAGERIGRIRQRVEVYPIEPRGYADRTFRTLEPGA